MPVRRARRVTSPAIEPGTSDAARRSEDADVAGSIDAVVERLRHERRARAHAFDPSASGDDSLAALASLARASRGARGSLESLAAIERGRALDRRAWLLLSGGAVAVTEVASLDDGALDEDARAWRHASAADDDAFLARLASPEWPFEAVHGENRSAVARAAVSAAADLLCRFGREVGVRSAPPDATPGERAAWRLARDVAVSASAAPGDVPGWVREAVGRVGVASDAAASENDARDGADERAVLDGLARAVDAPTAAGTTATVLLLWFHLTEGRMHLADGALDGIAPSERLPRALRPLARLLDDPHRPGPAPALADRLTRTGTLTRWEHGGSDANDEGAAARPAVPLPNRLDAVLPTPGRDNLARLEALAGADRRVHLGYVVPRGAAPRERRAVEAARLLRAADAPFVDVAALYARHAVELGPPGCTLGTYERTLAAFPHLLVEGVSHRWAVLDDEPPDAVPAPRGPDAPAAERRTRHRAHEGDERDRRGSATVADRVRECLEAAPVLRTGELVERLGDVPRGTVVGALDDDPGLRRFAPGLVAPHERLDALVADPPAALLDETQWRFLSDALRSGERPDDPAPLYPAWRGESLEALVRWGRGEGLRLSDARERLRDADLSAVHSGFEPRHLVAAIIECASRPSIGWMRLNRLLGARVDSRTAIWPVALLAGLGAVALEEHWQHPLATDRARARTLRGELFALARTRERLRWRDEGLRALLGRFDARDAVVSPAASAWLRSRRVAHFLDGRLGAG